MEKAKLDGKQTSGSRELGDQPEGMETIWEGGGAVCALTCGGYYDLMFTKTHRTNHKQEQIDRM